jgi:hypothetical protein
MLLVSVLNRDVQRKKCDSINRKNVLPRGCVSLKRRWRLRNQRFLFPWR